MCGINGFSWNDPSLIAAMNAATRHRGPDDVGVYTDGSVSLGHCRLSIIDLSPLGHEPMANEDQSLWCTYNGEVFNFLALREELIGLGHRFASHTDAEVVLHAWEAWGAECLDRFNGMWAFALYDRRRQELILARDRFGIKPLYYVEDDRGLAFSSMIAGLLTHPIRVQPNDRAVMEFLAFNLEQHNGDTFFEPIRSLRPGHLLVYDLKSRHSQVTPWYRPAPRGPVDEEALLREFTDSVRRWTVSDVPLGVCLSGGIDSTAITCTLDRHLGQPFNTYSLVAPGSPVDERKYIDEVGRHTRTQPFFTTVRPDEFLRDVHDFVACMEEPVAGLSAYAQYQVFKLAHSQGAKVLLDGQGGDEILAGYVYYYGYRFWELFARLRWWRLACEMVRCRRHFRTWFPHQMFAFLLLPRGLRTALWKRKVTPWLRHDTLQRVCRGEQDPRWRRQTVRESLNQTLASTSIPHNLMWEDKSSMRWSIESRVPFLDVHFVETALGLPTEDLLTGGETKVIFRRALGRILPPMIRDRKDKIGFEAPVDDFFRDAQVAAFAREILESPGFAQRPYWHAGKIVAMLDEHVRGKTNVGETLWKCLHVELWLRTFFPEAQGGNA
jgi:asparagine synthase (glutamine-hydrolysing)